MHIMPCCLSVYISVQQSASPFLVILETIWQFNVNKEKKIEVPNR